MLGDDAPAEARIGLQPGKNEFAESLQSKLPVERQTLESELQSESQTDQC